MAWNSQIFNEIVYAFVLKGLTIWNFALFWGTRHNFLLEKIMAC